MEEKEKMQPGEPGIKRRRRRGGTRHNRAKKAAEAQTATQVQTPPAAPKQKLEPSQNEKLHQPKPQVRTHHQAKPVAASEEDNSIQLISRRPPAQKFASFEEYMKAHGACSSQPEEEDASPDAPLE